MEKLDPHLKMILCETFKSNARAFQSQDVIDIVREIRIWGREEKWIHFPFRNLSNIFKNLTIFSLKRCLDSVKTTREYPIVKLGTQWVGLINVLWEFRLVTGFDLNSIGETHRIQLFYVERKMRRISSAYFEQIVPDELRVGIFNVIQKEIKPLAIQ